MESMRNYFYTFLFEQPHALARIGILRILVVGICLTMLSLGPYDTAYHTLFAPIMFQPHFPFPFFPLLGEGFLWLKIAAYATGFFALIGYRTIVALPLFTICYCFLNYYIHCFQEHYCMNQAHLNMALITLCFVPAANRYSIDAFMHEQPASLTLREKASFALTFIGGFIALLFFQTGLSKLLYGGLGWFLSGDTLYVETIFDGTDFGRFLTRFGWVFSIFGASVGFFELIFPFLFLFHRFHFIFGLIILLFHLGTYLIMGISFWFLWPLYIPLFLTGNHRK
jgi:hypothetical protein